MTRGKCISLYLIDGDVNGRIKCSLANWTGLVIKIPRTALDLCKDREELKQTGVYLLFGKDDLSEKNVVYVGQAGVRKMVKEYFIVCWNIIGIPKRITGLRL